METTLDLSRWKEKPRVVMQRRWVISQLGLRQLTQSRFFRILFLAAWIGGLGIAVLTFLFGQAVSTGGWLEEYAFGISPRFGAIASAFGAVILLYPDICVGGLFTLVFWAQSFLGLTLSLLALSTLIPSLVTKDRASNALTVYLSRPLTTVDYLLGKLGTIVGVLALLWTGPLLAGWLLSLAAAPSREFLRYSFDPLGRALLFHVIALVTLACIALGVSALARSSRTTVLIWLGLWLLLSPIAHSPGAPTWLRHASFTYNLDVVRNQILRPGDALQRAAREIPMLNQNLAETMERGSRNLQTSRPLYGYIGLGVLTLLSSAVFLRKLRVE